MLWRDELLYAWNELVKELRMFTREEALNLWDDLLADKDVFLYKHGEVVFVRAREMSYFPGLKYDFEDKWGYFVRANNYVYTKDMFEGYNRICAKHNASYRIEAHNDTTTILFYKNQKAVQDDEVHGTPKSVVESK